MTACPLRDLKFGPSLRTSTCIVMCNVSNKSYIGYYSLKCASELLLSYFPFNSR